MVRSLFRRYDDPTIYPISLVYDELGWKLAVGYDPDGDCFTIHVNDVPFMSIPFQATAAPDGPQIIENGSIVLNDEEILIDKQWSRERFQHYVE